jgi:quercetin dioxygenase-like cupin family protein
MDMHVLYKNAKVQTDNGTIVRKILATDGQLMLLEVVFHKASADDYGLHSHPHEQIAYVTRGSFDFHVEGRENVVLAAGDSVYLEPNVVHGGRPLEDDSALLDIFTPIREDFLV